MDSVPSLARRWLDPHFRWRGTDVSRMEAFADAVFAIVLALLFLQAKPPENLGELKAAMLALVPFAVTFTLLAMVWVEHHRFFRRYGLRDKATFFGNLWLLFLVLVYAYPLKFLFTLLFVWWVAPIGALTTVQATRGEAELGPVTLMIFYGAGFGAIYGTYGLLYAHALRRAGDLGLDAVERHLTVTSLIECGVYVGVAGLSLAIAACGSPFWSGMIYCALGPTMAVAGALRGSALQRLVARRGGEA